MAAVEYASPGSESEVEAGLHVEVAPQSSWQSAKPLRRLAIFSFAALAGSAVAVALRRNSSSAALDAGAVDAAISRAEAAPAAAPATVKCAAAGKDCRASRCCQQPGTQCFEKNVNWAMCLPSCTSGVHENDTAKEPWTCRALWSKAQVQKDWAHAQERAQKTLKGMEGAQKMSLLHGAGGGNGYAGYVNMQYVIPGAQALTMNDGPQGYNTYQERLRGTSTQFPALLSVAASFNPETSRRYAEAVVEEFVTKGSNVMLGPDVEVTRATLTGRSFETISGEDPFLGSQLVQPFVIAVQQKGVISTVKHWLDNNQEIYRQTMNVEVGDRAQHEIYMPVFKAAFDAGAAAVMCSYNKVYGEHACQNSRLLKDLLRQDLGFKGFVMSDWGATHNGSASVLGGLDVEMPTAKYLKDISAVFWTNDKLEPAVDEMATHVLSSMYYVGQMDGRFPVKGMLPKYGAIDSDATTDAHRVVARTTIEDSAILLKNQNNVLPLQTKGLKIAMVGHFCDQTEDKKYKQGSVWSGGGSGFVFTDKGTTPLQGVREHVKDADSIKFSTDASAAATADVAVICVAGHGEEGWDRANFSLPEAKDLIADVRKQNSKAKVVVLAAVPGAVTTEWLDGADAAVLMFMPGEQVGPAVARLLTGEAQPAGRLPISLPKQDEKRFTTKQYPGECTGKQKWCEHLIANFSEDVLVGYRWNDAMGVPSAFPFGFGLSYTEFEFKDVNVQCHDGSIKVSLKVANKGDHDSSAVPQVYVGFPSLKPALRQLRGFSKVKVEKGQEKAVHFELGKEDWSYFDVGLQRWVSATEKGEKITVSIGTSSVDLLHTKELTCGHEAKAIVRRILQ